MIKRAFDILASLLGLLLLGPFGLAVALWIKLDSKGPVFHRGLRVGRFGKPFRIFKFRSMVMEAEQIGGPSTSDDDSRITRVGRFMRRLKFDELPQLLNVLLGTMSFVGPRPEVVDEVATYPDEWKKVFDVRPGITDWASVWNADEGAILEGAADPHQAYRQLIQPTKVELQLKYCREHTFWTDIKLIFYTLFKIFKHGWVPKEIASYSPPKKASELSGAPQEPPE